MNNNEIRENKLNKSLVISLIILFVVIIFTGSLKYLTITENKKTAEVISKIEATQNEIDTIKKDKIIQIYSLVQDHKDIIEEKEMINQIPGYVKELKNIANKYSLALKTFNYNAWEIETVVISVDDDNWASFWKITSMLEEYRSKEDRVFDIDFVKSFKWNSRIEFTLKLRLKK